jgi:hypothetical protein
VDGGGELRGGPVETVVVHAGGRSGEVCLGRGGPRPHGETAGSRERVRR